MNGKLTAAEAEVLDSHLPAGLTDDMRDLALCLVEAMAELDARCGQVNPDADWLPVLHTMARVVSLQLQHTASQIAGARKLMA